MTELATSVWMRERSQSTSREEQLSVRIVIGGSGVVAASQCTVAAETSSGVAEAFLQSRGRLTAAKSQGQGQGVSVCVCVCVCLCVRVRGQLPPRGEPWATQCPNFIGIVAKVDQLLPLIVWRSPDCGGSSLVLALQAKEQVILLHEKNDKGNRLNTVTTEHRSAQSSMS